jgi:hypothetical protein
MRLDDIVFATIAWTSFRKAAMSDVFMISPFTAEMMMAPNAAHSNRNPKK